ncbi:zinc finger, Zim17-type [Rhodotorula toruloides]|uniref:Zinc finger, Zim17-type n=1 Tax=Rhodotorula toruloides TaxID=5286 RepID=A0A511KFA3_RHOTO|nr:zinc finger, Zim17-type [Rhodotorula toruloides]
MVLARIAAHSLVRATAPLRTAPTFPRRLRTALPAPTVASWHLLNHRRAFSSTSFHRREAQTSSGDGGALPQVGCNSSSSTPIGQIERRLRITFTCTASVTPEGQPEAEASACGHRSSHEFARRSYEKGVVIIQCPGCGNRHLIADHLHWFSQTPSPAHPTGQPIGSETPRTIEDLMREKGEQVTWQTNPDHPPSSVADADGRQQVRFVMRERQEEDGSKTIEVTEEDGAPEEQGTKK